MASILPDVQLQQLQQILHLHGSSKINFFKDNLEQIGKTESKLERLAPLVNSSQQILEMMVRHVATNNP